MNLYSTYSVKIKHYNNIFRPTVQIYRNAVDFFLEVILDKWDKFARLLMQEDAFPSASDMAARLRYAGIL